MFITYSNLFCKVLFEVLLLPLVLPQFVLPVSCDSCTLMFCFMSESKVLKEMLVLFNAVVESAGKTNVDCRAGWTREGGQVHFVTYAINSKLYIFLFYFIID